MSGVIPLVIRKQSGLVLLPVVPRMRAVLDTCRTRKAMTDYVLLTPDSKPYSESTIKRYCTTATAVVDIKRRSRFHDQRHTFASTRASKGINNFTLHDFLHHTSTRTMERSARAIDVCIRALA